MPAPLELPSRLRAGREGTAVQMGASLADAIAHRLRVGPDLRRVMLAAGAARSNVLHQRTADVAEIYELV